MPHHHHHCHDHKCCSDDSEDHCHSDKCHESKGEDGEDFAHHLLELADAAWRDVLKEKIKEEIKGRHSAKLDELARIVSEANSAKWKQKMSSKKGCKEFHEKLCHFFNQKD